MIIQTHKLFSIYAIEAIEGIGGRRLDICNGLTKTVLDRKIIILRINQGLDARNIPNQSESL